ncbi:MAG: acetyl-CoA carboxylase, biotin carboxyl carrier protein [Clostridiales bacterium]|nr:MAG: acetyl-CoA carboxylase, biotin carboxyl carrier protein [Clostridiales bacterium]
MKLTLEDVYSLMDKLSAAGLGELSLETDGVKVKIKAKEPQPILQAAPQPAASATASPAQPAPAAAPPELSGKVVKSPIVGTFYRSSSPDKDPFVQVGDSVRKGDTLFIIESMKLMNEVASDFDGKVAEILVENGQPVEFGQPVMRIE